MLYLMRKLGESIIINNNIKIQVVEVRGRSVKLGFEFPPDVTVLREEIHQRIMQENLAAMRSGADMDADAIGNLELPHKSTTKPIQNITNPPKPKS